MFRCDLTPSARIRPICSVVAAVALAAMAALAANAQVGGIVVTGVSDIGAAQFQSADGEELDARLDTRLPDGQLTIPEGSRVMLFDEGSNVVAVITGYAQVGLEDTGAALTLTISEGAILLAREAGPASEEDAAREIELRIERADADGAAPRITVGPGETLAQVSADRAVIGVRGGSDAEVQISRRSRVTLHSGEQVVLPADEPTAEPLGAIGNLAGFVPTAAEQLGIAVAQVRREGVEQALFRNIISWDRRAGGRYVVTQRETPFKPEVRQIALEITTPQRITGRNVRIAIPGITGANEVPAASPASATVTDLVNIQSNQTVIELTRDNPGQLLSLTNSAGLGFRGLSRLAIPGRIGGLPTIGPPGLGAGR